MSRFGFSFPIQFKQTERKRGRDRSFLFSSFCSHIFISNFCSNCDHKFINSIHKYTKPRKKTLAPISIFYVKHIFFRCFCCECEVARCSIQWMYLMRWLNTNLWFRNRKQNGEKEEGRVEWMKNGFSLHLCVLLWTTFKLNGEKKLQPTWQKVSAKKVPFSFWRVVTVPKMR